MWLYVFILYSHEITTFSELELWQNFDTKKCGPRFLDKKHNISTQIEHSWEPFLRHICSKETLGNHSSKCLAYNWLIVFDVPHHWLEDSTGMVKFAAKLEIVS